MFSVVHSRAGHHVKRQIRNVSKGALAGGFSREGLEEYAKGLWETDSDVITDLSSRKVTLQCSQWLEAHDDTSGELAKAYFGSKNFLPERILISPFFLQQRHLPEFREKDRFLAWDVTLKAPLEVICSWDNGRFKGLTMMAFDPKLHRVYHGNSLCVNDQTSETLLFSFMNQFHARYAEYLLDGMSNTLEQRAASTKSRH